MTATAASEHARAVADALQLLESAIQRRQARKKGNEVKFACPAHDDEHPSADWNSEKQTWHCFGCGVGGGWMDLAERLGVPVPKPTRITLEDLAFDKGLPVPFLRGLGIANLPDGGVGIPYRDGLTVRIKRRTALTAKEGSWWAKGQPLMAYGIDRLESARKAGHLLIGEGESDGWTAWYHDIPYLGIPGADVAKVLQAEHLGGIGRVYVLREPDQGGTTFTSGVAKRLAEIGWNRESFVFTCGAAKDLNALYLSDRPGFPAAVAQRLAEAQLLTGAASGIDSSATPAVADESILRFRTAREIAETTPATIEWVCRPWIARGSITELDAKIKLGKSSWATFMCRAVLTGAPFMGESTTKTAVVYLTEQAERTFRETLRRAGLLDRDDFHVLFWHDVAGLDWPAVVQRAIAYAESVGAAVIVVDTLPQFAGLKGDAENNAGDALTAIQPLQVGAALHNLAIVIVRHDRKSGGEVGDSSPGSSAFAGAVDTVVQMRRAEGNARSSIRVLSCLSRFDEVPDTLVIELTDEGYVAIGSEAAVAEREARGALLRAAPSSLDGALATAELMSAAGNPGRTVAYAVLEQLVSEGLLKRDGKGKKGDPHRYWRPTSPANEIHSSVPRGVVPDERNGHDAAAGTPCVADAIHSSGTHILGTDESIIESKTDGLPCEECEQPLLDLQDRQQGMHWECARKLATA